MNPDTKAVCDDFLQFLVDQTPMFDELIMDEIRPADGWLISKPLPPQWWEVREYVRMIIEGDSFVPSRKPKRRPPIDTVKDRFKGVFNEGKVLQ